MHPRSTYVCFLTLLQHVSSLVLKPVTPKISDGSLSKRASFSNLDLQNSSDFYWGASASSSAVLANLTVYAEDEQENILSMEKFNGMLQSVHCSNNSMSLAFKDEDTFDYAQRVWDWVNGNDNHSFTMVAGQGDCDTDSDRQPFNVNTIVYDTTERTAHLNGQVQDWKTAAHTYDLHVGHIASSASSVSRRDYTKDWSVDFNHDFHGSIKLSKGSFTIGLDSSGSNTAGEFEFELDIKTKFFVPHDVTAKLQPKGVSATAQTKLTVSGDLPDTSFGKSITVLSIPLDGIEIPGGILDIGPNLDIDVGFSVGPLSGTAGITGGVKVAIPDDAILELDLLDPSKNQFSGWNPSVDVLPWQIDAKISGSVQVFAQPNLNLKAEVLDTGYEILFGMKMPYLDATVAAIFSPTGACPSNPLPHHQDGVSFSSSYGAQLILEASKVNDVGDPLFKVTIADYNNPFKPLCWDFGPEIGTTTSSSGIPSPTINGTSVPPSSKSSPVTGNSTSIPTSVPSGPPVTLSTYPISNETTAVPITSSPVTSIPSSYPLPTLSTSSVSTTASAYVRKVRRAGFANYGELIEGGA